MRDLSRIGFATWSLLATLSAACSAPTGPGTSPDKPTLDHIEVTPATAVLPEGETLTLGAQPRDSSGAAFPGVQLTWSSSTIAVATVNQQGMVTALTPGTTTITATGGGKSGQAVITVPPTEIASVALDPKVGEIEMGSQLSLAATITDVKGRPSTAPVVWRSNRPSVATVNGAGVITTVAPGPVQISATAGGVTGTADFVVVPPYVAVVLISPSSKALLTGESAPLTVVLKSSRGDVLTGRSVVWESRDLLVASVNLVGQVLAAAPGVAWIVATSEGVADSILVTVSARPPEGFELTLVNNLLVNARVTLNGTLVADLQPQGAVVYFFAPIPTVRIAWQLVQPVDAGQPLGEAVIDTFPQTVGANGAKLRFEVGATLTDGRRLVTPFLTNSSGSTVLFEFGARETTLACGCIAPSGVDEVSGFGYWFLPEAQTLRLFRRTDFGHTGPMLSLPVPLGNVDPITGAWHYTILVGP